MRASRIAGLLEPFLGSAHDRQLKPQDLEYISTYIDILLRWNARINLTAIRDPEEIVTRHFGESLFLARHLFERASSSPAAYSIAKSSPHLADFGSGAGFPGIPIRIWAPDIALTLIESSQKKATFLREVSRALGLADINVANVRAETLTSATFDVVTLRAVERFADALATAARLVRPSGRLAMLISSSQLSRLHSSGSGFTWRNAEQVPMSQSRMLVIGTKEP
jgi:16S rRNA (guanine527-N7)-methyltransferase